MLFRSVCIVRVRFDTGKCAMRTAAHRRIDEDADARHEHAGQDSLSHQEKHAAVDGEECGPSAHAIRSKRHDAVAIGRGRVQNA